MNLWQSGSATPLEYSRQIRRLIRSGQLKVRAVLTGLVPRVCRLRIDLPIENESGIKGLHYVASYTDEDQGYLKGMVESCEAFQRIILYHDRSDHKFRYNESLRFQLLIASAQRLGATWVLIDSPKTRFSAEFRVQIGHLLERYAGTPTVLVLSERYLWGDFAHYASPKSAGEKHTVQKLFALTDRMVFDGKPLHAMQRPSNYTNIVITDASRYYLGRFNLATMHKKAQFYNSVDGRDYSFLTDVSTPAPHGEYVLGIGEFERRTLLNSEHSNAPQSTPSGRLPSETRAGPFRVRKMRRNL